VTAPELLADLARHGIRVRAADGKLKLSPADALTEELARAVRAHKPELLRLLSERSTVTPAECGWCGGALAGILFEGSAIAPSLHCRACHRWTVCGALA